MHRWTRAALAASLAAVAAGGRLDAQLLLQDPERGPLEGAPARVLLDVPFVPQARLLCGAAAVEMALRHAGARGIYARDFGSLVREDEGGIRTDELAAAVAATGWQVRSGPSDLRQLEADLTAGRPATVLLAEGPGRYHYVLVVGAAGDSLVVHDPGRRPGLAVPREAFLPRWEAAGWWSLVVLSGPAERRSAAPAAGEPSRESEPAAGASTVAPPDGTAATDPTSRDSAPPHPLLEDASRLFREQRWEDAMEAAGAAAAADPSDRRAWALFGTSSYLAGHDRRALDAWRHDRAPTIDRVVISGLERTRHPVVHELLGLRAGEPLLLGSLDRARRRLSLLPSAKRTSLSYRALPGGIAVVEGGVSESASPTRALEWLVAAVQGLTSSEVRVALPTLTGGGEGVALHARWAEARPGAGFALAVPAPRGLSGVLELRALWEMERHAAAGDEPVHVEARARARLALTDWATGWLRWEVGAGLDRWRGLGDAGTGRLLLELSEPGGAASLVGSVDASFGHAAATRYVRWTVEGNAEPLPSGGAWRLGARTLAAGVDADAPRISLVGADVGRAREGLLRAHALEGDGVLSPLTLASGLLNASIELERRVFTLPFSRVGVAAFVDGARLSGTRPGAPAPMYLVDAGLGLRFRTLSGLGRLDVAHGTDGSRAITLAWQAGVSRPAR